jgi:hypothetical protein
LAQRKGVITAPIGLSCELKASISSLFEDLDSLDSLLSIASNALVVLDGEIGEEVVETVHVPIPFNFIPYLIDGVV